MKALPMIDPAIIQHSSGMDFTTKGVCPDCNESKRNKKNKRGIKATASFASMSLGIIGRMAEKVREYQRRSSTGRV